MKLENEFTVPASIDDAWAVLLDVPRVAPCLPGATVEEGRRGRRVQGPDEGQDRPDHRQLQGHGQDRGGRRGRPPRRDARAGQGRARPGHRRGDDHLHDGGGRRRHEDQRRHRHAHHRPGGPVRARRDAGRVREDDDALRRLPGRADAVQPRRRAPRRGRGPGRRETETAAPTAESTNATTRSRTPACPAPPRASRARRPSAAPGASSGVPATRRAPRRTSSTSAR